MPSSDGGERAFDRSFQHVSEKLPIGLRLPAGGGARRIAEPRPVDRYRREYGREAFLQRPHLPARGDRAQSGEHENGRAGTHARDAEAHMSTSPSPIDVVVVDLHGQWRWWRDQIVARMKPPGIFDGPTSPPAIAGIER